MTVPSRTRCVGPAAEIGPVAGRGYAPVYADAATIGAAGDDVVWAGCGIRPLARTTAAATSSRDGGAVGEGIGARPVGVDRAGALLAAIRSPSARRVTTTLLANRLSYSRRARSC